MDGLEGSSVMRRRESSDSLDNHGESAPGRTPYCRRLLWPYSYWSIWLQRPQEFPRNIALAVASPKKMYFHQDTARFETRSGCSMSTRCPVLLPPVSKTWW